MNEWQIHETSIMSERNRISYGNVFMKHHVTHHATVTWSVCRTYVGRVVFIWNRRNQSWCWTDRLSPWMLSLQCRDQVKSLCETWTVCSCRYTCSPDLLDNPHLCRPWLFSFRAWFLKTPFSGHPSCSLWPGGDATWPLIKINEHHLPPSSEMTQSSVSLCALVWRPLSLLFD